MKTFSGVLEAPKVEQVFESVFIQIRPLVKATPLVKSTVDDIVKLTWQYKTSERVNDSTAKAYEEARRLERAGKMNEAAEVMATALEAQAAQ